MRKKEMKPHYELVYTSRDGILETHSKYKTLEEARRKLQELGGAFLCTWDGEIYKLNIVQTWSY